MSFIFFFFTFDLKIKLYTRIFDELVISEWDSWFEWLNRVTPHSVQVFTSVGRIEYATSP